MLSNQTQFQIRNKRESFRKQIRKAIVNTKLESLRKTLILDAHLCRPTQKSDPPQLTQNYELRSSDKTIQDLLKVLDKFSQKQILKCGYSYIKKFSQKLDSAVIVLAHIERLIIDENQMKSLELGMKSLSIQKMQLQRQNAKQSETNDLQKIERLKASTWQPRPQLTKLQTLKQIWQMTLLIKITTLIQYMERISRSSDYLSQIKYSQLIPLGLVKWLYFCQQNMKMHIRPHQKPLRNTVNSSHDHSFVLRQSYFEVSQRMIQFFTIGQINEIFFKPIFQISFMENLIHPKIRLVDLELQQSYIDCSPYKFFIHACDYQSKKFLIKLKENMQIKINQCQKFLAIEKIKIGNFYNYPSEHGKFLDQQKKELLRCMELLSIVQKYLQKKQKQEEMEPEIILENKQFLQVNQDFQILTCDQII